MSLEYEVQEAFERQDREGITKLMNFLRLDVLQAIRCDEWECYWDLEQSIGDALVPLRSVLRSDDVDPSLVAGQMYALHGIVQNLREGRATVQEMVAATRSEIGKHFLLRLRRHRRLTGSELKDLLGLKTDPRVSQLGRQLMDAGLVHRERIGRHASYRLTARGTVVTRELEAAELLLPRRAEYQPIITIPQHESVTDYEIQRKEDVETNKEGRKAQRSMLDEVRGYSGADTQARYLWIRGASMKGEHTWDEETAGEKGIDVEPRKELLGIGGYDK